MYILGITGISCSGKSTLSNKLVNYLGESQCILLSMDNYFKDLTPDEEKILYNDDSTLNFDRPEAVDLDLMYEHANAIKNGQLVRLPQYDMETSRTQKYIEVDSSKYKYLIIEGIMIFNKPEIIKLCNLKIWIETQEYICALRRFIKWTQDIKGYSYKYVYNQCINNVIPGQEKYVKPYRSICDIIVNGEKIETKIELITDYIDQN